MNKFFLYSIIAVLIVGVIYFTNSGSKKASNNNDLSSQAVTFGAVLALTGYAAVDGSNIKDGIELAKADLAKDGINLNIEYYDDSTDPVKSITGVEYMHSRGIKTIFGPTWSYQISAALPKISKYDMTAFIADTSSDVVDGDILEKQHLVHGVSPIYQISKPSAEWMKEQSVTKLAIFTVDGGWGIAHANAWSQAAEEAGVTVGLSEMFDYPNEPTILGTLLVKAKAQGIDGIVWTGSEAGAVALIKKMQEISYDVPVLGTNYLKVGADTGKYSLAEKNVSMIESSRSESFNEKYRAVYDREPNKYAESSYDLTMIAVKAELEKGTMSKQEYLLSKTHEAFAKEYKFDINGDIINLNWSVTKL